MKIEKLDITRLRNDAHFQFHTEVKDLVARTGANVLKIVPLFESYVQRFIRLDEAFKKINKSILTQQIHEADRARDDIWYGLVEMNRACLRHFDINKQLAARKIKLVLETYRDIAKKPINEQTSAIHNIIQDLTGTYAAQAAEVGITQWVTELLNRNSALDALMKERFDETAARCSIAVKTARTEVDAVYKEMIKRIDALMVVEGEADYEVFVNTLNAIVAKYKSNRKHPHHHHSGNQGEDDATEEEEI